MSPLKKSLTTPENGQKTMKDTVKSLLAQRGSPGPYRHIKGLRDICCLSMRLSGFTGQILPVLFVGRPRKFCWRLLNVGTCEHVPTKCTKSPKPLWCKDLRRARPARRDVNPCYQTTYDDSPMQTPCQRKAKKNTRKVKVWPLTMTIIIV